MAALDLKASSGPFVVDPRYEFDAPQFWDLNKVSQGLESPETEADSWFDAGARGEGLPLRAVLPDPQILASANAKHAAATFADLFGSLSVSSQLNTRLGALRRKRTRRRSSQETSWEIRSVLFTAALLTSWDEEGRLEAQKSAKNIHCCLCLC